MKTREKRAFPIRPQNPTGDLELGPVKALQPAQKSARLHLKKGMCDAGGRLE